MTSCYLGLLALVTVLASVGALSQSAILLDRSLVREELQLWRLGSAFLYTDGLGAGFAPGTGYGSDKKETAFAVGLKRLDAGLQIGLGQLSEFANQLHEI